MRVRFMLGLALVFVNVCGWAQSADRIEVFGGYSFASSDFTGGILYNTTANLKRGWNASANFRLNSFAQLVADFGGYYLPLSQAQGFCNFHVSSCSSSVHTLMFGPQLSVATKLTKLTPFFHGLFGAAFASQNGTFSAFQSNHSLILAAGGGIDYGLTRLLGVRGQIDYLHTNFSNGDNQVPFHNERIRISGGLVIRF